MDAATLYIVLKLNDGSEKTSTYPYKSVTQCEEVAKGMRNRAPPVAWEGVTKLYCQPHLKIAPLPSALPESR